MKIEIYIGDLVDKLSILSIKLEKFTDTQKLSNVRKEYEIIEEELKRISITIFSNEYNALRKINLRLWQIEDEIRFCESKKTFSDKFIELARSVYHENDKRAALKKEINLKYCSNLIEEKQYPVY